MRKITQDAVAAFNNNYPFKRGNTQIKVEDDNEGAIYTIMQLHGNTIALKVTGDSGTGLFISDGGWQTSTTKERLNGLSGVSIYQRNFQWFLNGEAWNGQKIAV